MAANVSLAAAPPYDAERVRRDFPILDTMVNGHPLVYLDSAASSQRPLAVLRAVEDYETHSHANVHRGVHALSQAATAAYEGARERVRRFINARTTREIIFVRGTTEGINLVAQAYARPRLRAGDEILISALEHHANIVPWQMVCEQTGCTLKWRRSTAAASCSWRSSSSSSTRARGWWRWRTCPTRSARCCR